MERSETYTPRRSTASLDDRLRFALAIIALDADKVRVYMKMLGFAPEVYNRQGDAFTGFMHMTRIQLINATPEQRRQSEEWLRTHGMPVPPKYIPDSQ